jgi:hypothetical protein
MMVLQVSEPARNLSSQLHGNVIYPESVAQNMHTAFHKLKQGVAIHLPASKDIFSDYSTTNKVRKNSIYPKKL